MSGAKSKGNGLVSWVQPVGVGHTKTPLLLPPDPPLEPPEPIEAPEDADELALLAPPLPAEEEDDAAALPVPVALEFGPVSFPSQATKTHADQQPSATQTMLRMTDASVRNARAFAAIGVAGRVVEG